MPEPVALLGTALHLPMGVDSAEKLFEVVSEKQQLSIDLVAARRYNPSDVQEGREQAWKLKSRYGFAFEHDAFHSYDLSFFQISTKVTKNLHLEQVAVLQAVYHAIEDAGLTLSELHNTTTGIFVGAYTSFTCSPLAPDETALRGLLMSTISDQVAYFLGTHGPSLSTETACSSSNVALSLAVQSLQRHECDVAIVAGTNLFTNKDFHLGLQACGVLVEGPTSHPFDEDGPKGFLRCEGTGAVVLRRMSDAEARGDRIICEIAGALAGSAGAAEGATSGSSRVYESPCETGMVQMMTRACSLANVSLKDVDYLECHATGTAVGDVIELRAIGAVYGDAHTSQSPLRVASLKSNIGHGEIAAGVFSLIKAAESLRRRVFLPTAGVTTPRKDFEWSRRHMRLQMEAEPFPKDKRVVMAVNSFGIGGSYAHVLLREYRPTSLAVPRLPRPARPSPPSQLFTLSAYSPTHLGRYAAELSAYLKADGNGARLSDVCATMALRRSRFSFRKSFVASSTAQLADQLGAFAANDQAAGMEAAGEDRHLKVLFVLTGQGSQWAKNGRELMHFPAYRDAAQRVDAMFESLCGWSVLEKIEALATADMCDTIFAQPITFLVQVGLLELLHSFHVYPDVVMGHSAGEVAAAYAAGLLTLEEAVAVVYHRSCEQQKLAGSGRMLAVGVGEKDAHSLLQEQGLEGQVEVACINSPTSTVLAGAEEVLVRLKAQLPESISSSLIPGNIAFHSSRVVPILDSMRRRLSFLQPKALAVGKGITKATRTPWSLPFISTVTGRVVTSTPPEYWCDNVRQPVLFQKAVENVFAAENAPEVVIEVGPHRTLVGPLMQTLTALGKGSSVTALSLLNRREPSCVASFLQALGAIHDRGVAVSLKVYYEETVGYALEAHLPKHPYVKKVVHDIIPILLFEMNAKDLTAGPAAGKKRVGGNTWLFEVSDRTCPTLMDHRMGGESILPGSWYTEMVLEAVGLPCTVTDVEFRSKLTIPRASVGDIPLLALLVLTPEQDGSWSFVIKSCPAREKQDEEPTYVEHCVGRVFKGDHLLQPDGSLRENGRRPQGQGLLTDVTLQDLGREGLELLLQRHSRLEHASRESFYAAVSNEGMNEYGPHFQGVTELRVDPLSRSVLGKIEAENEGWVREGGVLAPELMDSMTHLGLIYADQSIICYAGGYEATHALRLPSTKEVWALYVPDDNMVQVGRRKRSGDFLLYDGEGRLLLHQVGSFFTFALVSDHYKTLDATWQRLALATPAAALAETVGRFVAEERGKEDGLVWAAERHGRMSAWVEAGEDRQPPVALPRVARLQEEGRAQALLAKVGEAAAAVVGGKGEQKGEEAGGEEAVGLSVEEARELVQWASGQQAEAGALARALVTVVQQEQQRHQGSETFGVLRVLEVAEAEDCPTVAEPLSYLSLPDGVIVECFVASHSASVLRTLAKRVRRNQTQVLLRRVLLSTDSSPGTVLRDLTFHALIIDDWARTGAAALTPTDATADLPSRASLLLDKLRPLLAPHAHVVVRGFTAIPTWARSLTRASPTPLADTTDSEAAAMAEARADWLGTLRDLRIGGEEDEGVTELDDLPLLLTRLPQALPQRGGRFLVVAHTPAQADEIGAALLAAAFVGVEATAVPLVMDDSMTTDEVVEQLGTVLQGPIEAIVVAAGLDDASAIGEDGHSRLLRLLQALSIQDNTFITLLSSQRQLPGQALRERPPLYVLTEGVWGGDIKPNQAVLHGLVNVCDMEIRPVGCKHLDLATTTDKPRAALLPTAMALVLGNFREQTVCVRGAGHAVVPRCRALDTEKARRMELRPSDERCYYAAVTAGGAEALRNAQILMPGVVHASFQLSALPPPQDDEVVVEIEAAALNFRDVMISLSLLPEQSYERSYFGKNFGMEAAGVVSRVGSKVTDLAVGDRVAVAEPRTFANRIIAKADRVGRLPEGVSFVDAAATQSVYNTCQYALVNLARVRRGERVLIHSAAGGIGHAAVAICQFLGAEILATAGSEEKRQIVRDLGVAHVFDSRSTSWYEDVMKATQGEGVDVVLNSLAGAHQRLGLQALRSSGRFCEIGKVDIFANSHVGLLAFRKNISFFAIDMDRMALDNPALTREVTKDVALRFAAGDYRALPVTTFPMGQIREALELMKTGKHVGKVVLVNRDADGHECPVFVEKPQTTFRPDVSYLVTGGAGGFGHRLISYAIWQGARHFVVTTTKADAEAVRATAFRDLLGVYEGVTIDVVTCDTGVREDVERLVGYARSVSPPVKAVFHVAGVSGDVRLPEMKDREDFGKVARCKALGAWLLHELTLDMGLETFVTVSSISAKMGGMGNGAYSPANAFLDALVRYRRSMGLPGHSYNMSSLSDVGLLTRNVAARNFQRKMGVEFMTSLKALETIELGLVAGFDQLISLWFTERSWGTTPSKSEWSHGLDDALVLGMGSGASGPRSVKEIAQFLIDEIKSVTQASEVQPNATLISVGLDSFGFIELGGRIQKAFGIDMNSLKLTPDKTLVEVASLIHKLQKRESSEGEEEGEARDEGVEQALSGEVSRSDVAPLLDLRTRSRRVSAEQAAEWINERRRAAKGEVIFLLGATGIAGAHILRYLIKQGNAKVVYCLVRASSREVAASRVRRAMEELKLWKDSFAPHIVALPGDIVKEDFGLSPGDLDEVRAKITGVVHAAGARSWTMDRQSLDCNVKGLMRTAALAGESHVPLHFVSSGWLDLYDAALEADKPVLTKLPYVGVKLRAEEVLAFAARQAHVACNVIRLPLLSVNRRGGFTGEFVLFSLAQGMYLTRCGNLGAVYPIMPTDAAAKDFVAQMKHAPRVGGEEEKYRLYTSSHLCDWFTTAEVADLVDEVVRDGRYVDRYASLEKTQAVLEDTFGKDVLEAINPMGWIEATVRAAHLAAGQSKRRGRVVQAKRALAKGVLGKRAKSAALLLKEYVRARPELILEGSLVDAAREALKDGTFGAVEPAKVTADGQGPTKADDAGSATDSASVTSSESNEVVAVLAQ